MNNSPKNTQRQKNSLKLGLGSFIMFSVFVASCIYLLKNSVWEETGKTSSTNVELNSPTPLGFVTLSGTPLENGVRLSWLDRADESFRHFEIEKSTNGKDFLSLGSLNYGKQDGSFHSYSFIDSLQRQGEANYRLKKVSQNGEFTYSPPILINSNTASFDYALSSNSKGNEVLVYVKKNLTDRKIGFEVWNWNGFLVSTHHVKVKAGKSDLKLKTGHLQSGVYIVNSSMETQGKLNSRKFIIP
ncbi:MAG: hypothetical protein MRZ79_20240 [Bacteroidia bacterium]|nr:hypothetical protein [Bacteroidia bacterium]